jgi:hypothetical protein
MRAWIQIQTLREQQWLFRVDMVGRRKVRTAALSSAAPLRVHPHQRLAHPHLPLALMHHFQHHRNPHIVEIIMGVDISRTPDQRRAQLTRMSRMTSTRVHPRRHADNSSKDS